MHFLLAAVESAVAGALAIFALAAVDSPAGVSDAVLIAVITSVTTLIVAIITLSVSIVNSRHLAAQSSRLDKSDEKLDKVAAGVDGVTKKLVASTERAATAEGVATGIAQERADPQSPATPAATTDSPAPVQIVQGAGDAPVRVKAEKKPRA